MPMVGIFSRTDAMNPYRNYTIVSVLYCSGDLHLGNYDWSYFFGTVNVKQRGQKNFMSVFAWLQSQIQSGKLGNARGRFKSLVLSGSSAGALAQQVWSGYILPRLKYDSSAVIVDSLAGLFPHSALKLLLKKYGVCKFIGQINPALTSACTQSQMTIQDVLLSTLQSFPATPFAFIQSKDDAVQTDFYDGVDLTQGLASKMLDTATFYTRTQSFLQSYNNKPNWLIYWINSQTHEYLTQTWFFKTNSFHSFGPDDISPPRLRRHLASSNSSAPPPALHMWVSSLPLSPGAAISSECSDASGRACDAAFEDKVYVQTAKK